MGVSTSSTEKQLLWPHRSLLMSTTSPISACPSLFVFVAVKRCISLKVQRNLWHFKIWISKVPDFGCQEWRGVSSPNSCLTEADSLPAASADQVWQAPFKKGIGWRKKGLTNRPNMRCDHGPHWQEPTKCSTMHRVSSVDQKCWISPSESAKPEPSDANRGIITGMTAWYTMQKSKCTPVTFPHSRLLCIVHSTCPVVSTPYKTLQTVRTTLF